MLELGCGLGAVGLAAGTAGAATVLLTDREAPLLALAAQAADANGLAGVVSTATLEWDADEAALRSAIGTCYQPTYLLTCYQPTYCFLATNPTYYLLATNPTYLLACYQPTYYLLATSLPTFPFLPTYLLYLCYQPTYYLLA